MTAATATLDEILAHETAKDIRLNLRLLRESQKLTPAQAWGTALASAIASRCAAVTRAVAAEATPHLSPEGARAARVAGTMMGLTNVYYRFLHLVDATEYGQLPAGLRMQSLGNPGVPKVDFELWSLAASAVKGCGSCVASHERHLRQAGVAPEAVQEAVRIASVVHAAATAADAAAALDER
jgi:alkyl hydroperoxide reductase subunit D